MSLRAFNSIARAAFGVICICDRPFINMYDVIILISDYKFIQARYNISAYRLKAILDYHLILYYLLRLK